MFMDGLFGGDGQRFCGCERMGGSVVGGLLSLVVVLVGVMGLGVDLLYRLVVGIDGYVVVMMLDWQVLGNMVNLIKIG